MEITFDGDGVHLFSIVAQAGGAEGAVVSCTRSPRWPIFEHGWPRHVLPVPRAVPQRGTNSGGFGGRSGPEFGD